MANETMGKWGPRELFIRDLRAALTQLYNPGALRASSLVPLLGLAERREPALALQNVLLEAIEGLRPSRKAPQWSQQWRTYQVLRRRYSEQVPQCTVASDLGLSIRQLQREERQAREVLADRLWAQCKLEAQANRLIAQEHKPASSSNQAGSRAQELAWLRDHVPPEMTDVTQLVGQVLATVAPLLQASCVTAQTRSPADFPALPVPGLLLQQALLSSVTAAVGAIPGGSLRIAVGLEGSDLSIRLLGISHEAEDIAENSDAAEGLLMAEEILAFCGGTLEVETTGPVVSAGSIMSSGLTGEIQAFGVRLLVPIARQGIVLVVDDNADSLELFQRYLAGSHYHFMGVESAEEAMALVAGQRPDAIVVDVMMPRQDGWALLGQLREHPGIRGIPVIVCTILPQEELALTLGAAAFLRKPVSREALLGVLDCQIGRSPPAP